jgi:acetyl esterase/lipase
LPPLLIQAGSHEVLLDDATRLVVKAAADDVAVILDITPGIPHAFQAFAALLDEGDAALNRAARFVRDNTAQRLGVLHPGPPPAEPAALSARGTERDLGEAR